jgi:hypothetical protein
MMNLVNAVLVSLGSFVFALGLVCVLDKIDESRNNRK